MRLQKIKQGKIHAVPRCTSLTSTTVTLLCCVQSIEACCEDFGNKNRVKTHTDFPKVINFHIFFIIELELSQIWHTGVVNVQTVPIYRCILYYYVGILDIYDM